MDEIFGHCSMNTGRKVLKTSPAGKLLGDEKTETLHHKFLEENAAYETGAGRIPTCGCGPAD